MVVAENGKRAVEILERDTFDGQNRGKETPNLYAESGTTKLTKERAYALMLEEHPEVYGAFVAQHNAKGLIATLERAGVRLAR